MARKPTDRIRPDMQRSEAQAMIKVFEIGLAVVNALALIKDTGAAERGRNAVNRAVDAD